MPFVGLVMCIAAIGIFVYIFLTYSTRKAFRIITLSYKITNVNRKNKNISKKISGYKIYILCGLDRGDFFLRRFLWYGPGVRMQGHDLSCPRSSRPWKEEKPDFTRRARRTVNLGLYFPTKSNTIGTESKTLRSSWKGR